MPKFDILLLQTTLKFVRTTFGYVKIIRVIRRSGCSVGDYISFSELIRE